MYDDLLGEKKKKAPCGIDPKDCTDHKCHKCFDTVEFQVQDCEWDDKTKKIVVKREYKIECDKNGVVKWGRHMIQCSNCIHCAIHSFVENGEPHKQMECTILMGSHCYHQREYTYWEGVITKTEKKEFISQGEFSV